MGHALASFATYRILSEKLRFSCFSQVPTGSGYPSFRPILPKIYLLFCEMATLRMYMKGLNRKCLNERSHVLRGILVIHKILCFKMIIYHFKVLRFPAQPLWFAPKTSIFHPALFLPISSYPRKTKKSLWLLLNPHPQYQIRFPDHYAHWGDDL